MSKPTEKLVAIVCGAFAVGVGAALAMQGQPTWVIVASGLAAASTFVAGQLGVSTPSDRKEIQRLNSIRPPRGPV